MKRRRHRPGRGALIAPLLLALLGAATGCEGDLGRFGADGTPAELPPVGPGGVDGGMATGGGEGGTVTPPGQEEVDFDRTAPYVRRLTELQYHNTIRQALGDQVDESSYPKLDDAIPTIGLSNDPSYLGVDNTVISELYESTSQLARQGVERLPLVSACVAASEDACFEAITRELGEKLWRRPLSQEEVKALQDARQRVAAAPGTRAEQGEFLLQALLMSPNALYRTEISAAGTAELKPGERLTLADYELAQSLSYTLWNSPPDAQLSALAADGTLSDPEVYAAQVERMLKDDRVAEAMTEFFVDFLKIDKLYDKEKDGAFGLNPEAKRALVTSARRDIASALALPGASLYAPFGLTQSHLDAQSAPFFGVEGDLSQGGEIVALDGAQRYGVLSHPAFLSVHSGKENSGIVKRGVFTLEQLLCEHLGAPPNDISGVSEEELPEGFDPARATSREALYVQHSSQAACYACHVQIDPAGFGYENYDAAGRWRTVEKGDIAIDAAGSLKIGDEEMTFTTSVDYVRALSESSAMKRCFTERLMSYVLGEKPSEIEHEQFLARFNEVDGALMPSLNALLQSKSFATRQIAAAATEETEP